MPNKIDLTGRRFGKLVVLKESGTRYSKLHWVCRCDCGREKEICGASLRTGLSKSCGCGVAESNIRRSAHGMTGTPEHKAWRQLKARCNNPNNPGYSNYGGRGISVCQRWEDSFECFLSDMGPKPASGYSVDRIDTNGDYSPDNCRWATRQQQARNTRRCKYWIIEGRRYESLKDAADGEGLYWLTILNRIKRKTPGYKSIFKYGEQNG